VRDEDIDWQIYHRIALGEAGTIPELISITELDEEVIRASVQRLVGYLLIRQEGELLHPMGLEEMLLSCRIRYTKDLPVTIENGVIKIRSDHHH